MVKRKGKPVRPKTPGPPPSGDYMKKIFRECGLNLSDDVIQRFWTLHQLLRARNEELDLTRIHNFESMVIKHYVDCALVPGLTDLPSPLLDIGTGAGFPGIPLMLVRPDLDIILAESRGKKLAFIDEAGRELGLKDLRVYPHKVTPEFDLPVQGIITRDLESIAKTLEKASGFLPSGGRVIFMKGPSADEEIEDAQASFSEDFVLESDRAYRIGNTANNRRLVVFNRISRPAKRVSTSSERIQEVASRQNPKFKLWKKILEPRGIRKNNLAVMSGKRFVTEVLRDYPEMTTGLIDTGNDPISIDLPEDIPRYRLRPELFRELDELGTGPPLVVTRVPTLMPWSDDDWPEGLTLFVPFQDPSNVGAVIRSAAALGAARVVLLKEAGHPFHPRSLRAAGPTVFRVELMEGPSLSELRVGGAPLLALDTRGTAIDEFPFPPKFGLVAGLEGPGLPGDIKAERLSIPMNPGVESLNAAVAAGIVMYEWRRRAGIGDRK